MPVDRPDLGALLHRLSRHVIDQERPILAAHGIDMWDYVLLTALLRAPAASQAQLAAASGRDKTRLIGNLDRLAEAGLIARDTDPEDRRHKIVSVTARGRQIHRRCQRQIRTMENRLLGELAKDRRVPFVAALLALDEAIGGPDGAAGTSSA